MASVERVAGHGAKTFVTGHKRPDASDDDVATMLEGTRDSIRDLGDAVAV
jgi:hypothetical protein